MGLYSVGFQKASITATGAIVDIAAAASDRAKVTKIQVLVSAMTGTTPVLTIGLSRATAIGTRTTPTTLQALDPADGTATSTSATAWSVAPTLAATPLERFVVNAVGAGFVWTFNPGSLVVPLSGSLVLHVVAIAGTSPNFTLDGTIQVDE